MYDLAAMLANANFKKNVRTRHFGSKNPEKSRKMQLTRHNMTTVLEVEWTELFRI